MSAQYGSISYVQSFGSSPNRVTYPHLDVRAPALTDILYGVGTTWVDTVNENIYVLSSLSSFNGVTQANWNALVAGGGSAAFSGSVIAGTFITATDGNITATDGNIVRGTAGNKDIYSSVATTTAAGANSAGSVTLVGGTATIATTSVTASSLIRLSRQAIGATGAADLGFVTVGTIVAGVSFDINAVQPANATALQATDVSVIFWEIVN